MQDISARGMNMIIFLLGKGSSADKLSYATNQNPNDVALNIHVYRVWGHRLDTHRRVFYEWHHKSH